MTPYHNISEYIDYFIKPIVQNQETYIKDTTDFINKLSTLHVPENAFLVTLDVVSMYTNTPQAEAIKAITEALDSESAIHYSYKINKPSTQYIKDLLTFILQHNSFEFCGNFFKQICGVSMESPASPEIADITFHNLERRIIELHQSKIHFSKHFRDDVFMVYTGTEKELWDFTTNINELHQTFKFLYEYSAQSITYLDLVIYKGLKYSREQILDTRTHTNTF